MRALATCALAAIWLFAADPSFGQQSPNTAPAAVSAPAPATTPDEAGGNILKAATRKKRAQCRRAGMGQALRGPDLQDQVAVCVQEARLACLKQAIAQKARGPQRAEFIAKCLGS
jgi:hypothetical protein